MSFPVLTGSEGAKWEMTLGGEDSFSATDVHSYSDHSYSDILATVTKIIRSQMAFLIVNMHDYSDACLQ